MYVFIIASFYHIEKYDYTKQCQITNTAHSIQVWTKGHWIKQNHSISKELIKLGPKHSYISWLIVLCSLFHLA